MTICRYCRKQLNAYKEHDICDECAVEYRNSYPEDGDECNICGGRITYLYTQNYESAYECEGCGEQWFYD